MSGRGKLLVDLALKSKKDGTSNKATHQSYDPKCVDDPPEEVTPVFKCIKMSGKSSNYEIQRPHDTGENSKSVSSKSDSNSSCDESCSCDSSSSDDDSSSKDVTIDSDDSVKDKDYVPSEMELQDFRVEKRKESSEIESLPILVSPQKGRKRKKCVEK